MKSVQHYAKAVQNRTMDYINQRRGWTIDRKIIVIESDDWGSIRMPSKEVYDKLLNYGIRVDKCSFCSNDSIASEDDLSLLFDMLYSIKDFKGNSLCLTANAVVANPDFDKIRESNFNDYHYKLITDGFKEIKGCENSLSLWKQGLSNNCFFIQNHGREHINVDRWLNSLRQNLPETKYAFDLGVYGISTKITSEKRKSYLPAFDFESLEQERKVNEIVEDGLDIFKQLFGYNSESFIAPNYVWGKSLENVIHKNGVKFIQGISVINQPILNDSHYKLVSRYLGEENNNSQINLVRNVTFEPSLDINKDWIDSSLSQIDSVFKLKKPAIISSHRVNYIGRLNPINRDRNILIIKNLFKEILKKWPDVEFMNSVQLGTLIYESK